MITREKAQERIYDVINSGIIDEDLETDLQEIAHCIEFEQFCLHMWGADDMDVGTLVTSMRTDIPEYAEHVKKQQAIAAKHRFTPSEFEKDE